MTVREATVADLPAILAIYRADALTGRQDPVRDNLSVYEAAFRAITSDPHQHVLVAEHGAVVVGTLQLTIVQYVIARALRRALVEAVFVDPLHQGRGVGTALMRHAIALARAAGCRSMELTSYKDRERAHAFYTRLGFRALKEGLKLELDALPPAA